MSQKIIKIGKSTGITISKDLLEEMGVKAGDKVDVKYDKDNQALMVKPDDAVTQEFKDWLDKFTEEYRPALEALADK